MRFLLQKDGLKQILPEVKARLTEEEMKFNYWVDMAYRKAVDYIPQIVSALLVLLFGMWLINRIARISERAMGRRQIDISLRTFLKSLISIGLKIILIVTVAGMIGIGTASFVTILGAAGLAIGLALQGSLSNFAGGVLLLIFKPFRVGDSIEAGGQTGEVREIQIFNTILLTGENKTVILPNGPLSNGTIVNNTRHGTLRVEINMAVSADSDLTAVRKLIFSELEKHDMVLKIHNPQVFVSRISDGSANFQIMPFCLPQNAGTLKTDLYMQLKLAFEKHQIKPGIPGRIIHQAHEN
jgi:small conductance mechanosensitive channel